MAGPPVKTIIFDLGDVLCRWKPPTNLSVDPKLLKEFRNSPTWYKYDCGEIGEDECFSQLAGHGNVPVEDVKIAFQQARDSQAQNDKVVETITELRAAHPDLKIYAMSNISRPDWEILRGKDFNWNIFDRVFTSSEAGMCKPELRFFHHVLKQIQMAPSEAVFVDDKLENVIAAQSVGFRETIVFVDVPNMRRALLNVLEDPVRRGRDWLRREAGHLYSETDTGVVVPDNFAQLLTYELTGDLNLLSLKYFDRTWNYFIQSPFGTSKNYPDDVDTTSYAYKLLSLDRSVASSIMDEMISSQWTTADNIVQGTRYYHQPDTYLYFFARLLNENPESDMFRNTSALLRERLNERINTPADSLGLAMRVLACHYMGIRDELDLQQLMKKQQEDGSFEIGWLCQYGKTQMKLGNRGLTTALAVTAIKALS
ncbi:Had-like protein [Lasiodiplodia theobromae]|uniref:Had-like protein n=1 Tax=Lasiodiplodia theobromae TaxID=45133 RepID=UPI0015C31CE3|nr:Had-like protein [Lasiodiplodia theobromae]KAF4538114.1 Had-like protein [Lasiodiplodia theobromae]